MANYITPLTLSSPNSSSSIKSIVVNGQPYFPDPSGQISFNIDTSPKIEVLRYAASHILTELDCDNHLVFNSPSEVILTVPLDLTLEARVGTTIRIEQEGLGQVLVNGLGILRVKGSVYPKTAERYAVATLVKVAESTWTLYGELQLKSTPDPDPDPDPIEGQLVDSSGNALITSEGDILVLGESEDINLLINHAGDPLVDSIANRLKEG